MGLFMFYRVPKRHITLFSLHVSMHITCPNAIFPTTRIVKQSEISKANLLVSLHAAPDKFSIMHVTG